MNTTTAAQEARNVFANATVDQVQTVVVSTFVQVDRFTDREARDIRRWAVQAMVEKVGHQATVDWVAEVTA